jgi:hypothetical protein
MSAKAYQLMQIAFGGTEIRKAWDFSGSSILKRDKFLLKVMIVVDPLQTVEMMNL